MADILENDRFISRLTQKHRENEINAYFMNKMDHK